MPAKKYEFPREVGETVVIAADSREALRKAAQAAYHPATSEDTSCAASG